MLGNVPGPWSPWYGRLAPSSFPYHNPIIVGAFVFAVVVGLMIAVPVLYYRKVGYFFREWLTSLDHKKIGVMYIVIGLVMLFRGFIDAMMIRTQQVMADGPHTAGHLEALHGYIPPFHFDQVYSSHGVIMIFLAITPIITGLANIVIPMQIGARDMAFPFLNATSLYLTAVAAALVMASLFIGEFSHAGWIGITPFTELPYSPDVGVDYWIWALQISGIATTLNSVNMIATVVRMRAPGLTWFRLPIFTWAMLGNTVIGLTAFPVLTVALTLLAADRYLGTHFFTVGHGGNLMLYTDIFWIWGHPEVYFLILPAFGIVSEIIPVFAQKPLFGYRTMVFATIAISGISWSVWLHHFFTMGAAPDVNLYFSIATMLVGIPTGVKVFNWGFTLRRGRLLLETPMLWALGAIFLLLAGGFSGMMLAIPAINYTVHNSVFVIAHFHSMVLMTAYALFAAIIFWFPKIFGFRLDEAAGKKFFITFSAGSVLVFVSMYALGFEGQTRRLDYLYDRHWMPFLVIEEIGIFLYTVSLYYFGKMIWVSVRHRRREGVDHDPWGGHTRTVDWLTRTPVPFYNFAVTPVVHVKDERAWREERGLLQEIPQEYEAISLPKNSFLPMAIGVLAFGLGFGLVWRIWWMAGLSILGIIGVLIIRAMQNDIEYELSAEEVKAMDRRHAPINIVEEHKDAVESALMELHL
jgi:cytochrome o ubiquinol oxidase subunit 1